MCQGIPHYNSTVLALSCLSLRDALFESCLKKLKVKQHIQWRTRVGSDDKGTVIGIDKSQKDSYYQYLLFGQCEHASERLHSMELSVKSASGHVMYELNSAFMANLETLSPTIKFASASTDTIGTTSCTSFVNESYSRIRQMRENGCSSLTCSFAHSLNSAHFYEIFDTNQNGENDLREIFGKPLSQIPYDFGVYPTYDIDLQDIIGPEYHNYQILKKYPTSDAVRLLYTEINKRPVGEIFPDDQEAMMKKDHFGINQGLVRQLEKMRQRLHADADAVEKYFIDNPFMIIRGPETVEETKFTILSKLFTKGASESLRRTSPAIYIGRLSAFRTAKAWTSPFQNSEMYNVDTDSIESREMFIKSTYKDFLKNSLKLINHSKKAIDFESLIPIMYPQHKSYNVIENFVGQFGALKSTTKHYSQAVRSWTVNNFNYEYSTSLRSIIETSFGRSQESTTEDVEEFRKMLGMRLDSLDSFKEECKHKSIRPLDMFYYMSKLYKSSKSTRIQAFGSGPSTSGLHMTASILKKYNHSPGMTVQLDVGMDEFDLEDETTLSRKLDNIKLFYNLILMQYSGNLTGECQSFDLIMKSGVLLSEECKTIVRSIRSLSGFDYTTQKSLKFVACELLAASELREKLISWRMSNYSYIKKQRGHRTPSGKTQWVGDLIMLVNSSEDCYTLHESKGHRYITCRSINDLGELYRSLREMCQVTGFDMTTFFTMTELSKGDIYMSASTKTLHRSEVDGVMSQKLNLRVSSNFQYRRLLDMQNFKIKRKHDPKTFHLEYYLEDQGKRSATICHTNGNYYPVELPNCGVNGSVKYLGVDVSFLFKNKSWFYNYKLPMMNETERLSFLATKIDFETLLALEGTDKRRIQDYIEVREEINEESFSIMRTDGLKVISEHDQALLDSGATFDEIFRVTIEDMEMPTSLLNHHDVIEDWAEEVENDLEQKVEQFSETLKDDGNIELINAVGYKRPMAKRAMMTINGLQQGTFMKSRILDCFFTSQNIRNERTSQLPNMLLWLDRIKPDDLTFIPQPHRMRFIEEMVNHVVRSLEVNTGAKASHIRNMILNSNSYGIPVQTIFNLMNNETVSTNDLLGSILDVESDNEYSNDEESEMSD
ncbi:RNA dependent RNA polymerase [Plasmopara viticola lesion associated mycobunyavirales-like virus 4]|uniref:RNA dependent RNA polymerase n=1 Tax=Plasmopara viticola lesion associated mycobunyavirales-like virus 4 TaxID=2689127 RepID=A0A6B9HD40_9VIRU|nr:RNA dependent RNA polymerase [Plasmopara viticola lesion associated mycobunyavirales-like virus 4]QGY72641.1 RNA dependent RNA polymerase [Plasmopara viticola lesion associated mycobunyavirales-like virus 4]